MGRDFPIDAENMDVAALQSAIAECFVSLEIVGRRVYGEFVNPRINASARAVL